MKTYERNTILLITTVTILAHAHPAVSNEPGWRRVWPCHTARRHMAASGKKMRESRCLKSCLKTLNKRQRREKLCVAFKYNRSMREEKCDVSGEKFHKQSWLGIDY